MTQKRKPRADQATGQKQGSDFEKKNIPFKLNCQAFLKAGFSVIPAHPATKKPTLDSWKPYQQAPMNQQAAAELNWPGFAVITGRVSGNVEALDFDFKAEWFDPWAEIAETEAPGLVARLLQQRTQSGGRHVIYRCPDVTIPGNTKLAANKVEVDGPGDHEYKGKIHRAHQEGGKCFLYPCYIETRGKGGYFLAAPTPGYALESGDFLNLPEITPAERDFLIKAAKALDKNVKPKYHKQPTVNGTRPGDIYNQEADPRPILEDHGWTPAGGKGDFEHYTRPGKNRGISASLIDGKIFHCFTSNAPPLEPDTAYTPFLLYATLEHGGDFEAAAKELYRQGYRSQKKKQAENKDEQQATEKKAWSYARELMPRILYPWDVLPDPIAESLQALARSCATEADQLPGMACAIIGAALGRTISISLKQSWIEPVVIWVVDIRHTGEGKTPAMQALSKNLKRVQKKEHVRFDRKRREWEAKPPKERGEPPKPPRGYYCTDLTLEGLRADLEEHPTGGIVALLNEASTLISGQNQYKQKGTDREAWLKLHDGDDARVVRAAKSMLISGARVQVVGGIQPAILRRVFGGEEGQYLADGTVYRCLFTYAPAGYHPLTLESWNEKQRSLWEYTLESALKWADNQTEPHVIRLTEEAQEIFLNWRNALDREKMDLPAELRGFLPKAYGYALRLAATLDCIHQFYAGQEPPKFLDAEGIERGIRAAMFYLGQAVDAIRLILGEELTADPMKEKILAALQELGEMTATEIFTDVFQKNKSSSKIRTALSELMDAGLVIEAILPTEGRSKKIFKLNVKNVKNVKSRDTGNEDDAVNDNKYVKNVKSRCTGNGENYENAEDEIEI